MMEAGAVQERAAETSRRADTKQIELVALSGADHLVMDDSQRPARSVLCVRAVLVRASGVMLTHGKWYYEATVEGLGGQGRSHAFKIYDAHHEHEGDSDDEVVDITNNTELPSVGGRGAIGWATSNFWFAPRSRRCR